MARETLAGRVEKLESKIHEIENQLKKQAEETTPKKRGWRSFVGIYADSPDFDEVERIGQEWRNADRPELDEKIVP